MSAGLKIVEKEPWVRKCGSPGLSMPKTVQAGRSHEPKQLTRKDFSEPNNYAAFGQLDPLCLAMRLFLVTRVTAEVLITRFSASLWLQQAGPRLRMATAYWGRAVGK